MSPPTLVDSRAVFSPQNWAHQALMQMDEANALATWASVSMPDVSRYEQAVAAFWRVVGFLQAERDRLEAELRKASPPGPAGG